MFQELSENSLKVIDVLGMFRECSMMSRSHALRADGLLLPRDRDPEDCKMTTTKTPTTTEELGCC